MGVYSKLRDGIDLLFLTVNVHKKCDQEPVAQNTNLWVQAVLHDSGYAALMGQPGTKGGVLPLVTRAPDAPMYKEHNWKVLLF
jgi:hypothetical protein